MSKIDTLLKKHKHLQSLIDTFGLELIGVTELKSKPDVSGLDYHKTVEISHPAGKGYDAGVTYAYISKEKIVIGTYGNIGDAMVGYNLSQIWKAKKDKGWKFRDRGVWKPHGS